MPEMIRDGTGTGVLAKVDSNNKLQVKAITEVENKFVNLENEEAFLLYSDITPTGTGDNFLYVKNTHTKDLILNWYRIWSGANAEAIDIYTGMTGTPAGTTTLTPSNTNITSSTTATGLFYEGVDITGLSGGTLMDRLRLSGDGNDVTTGYPGDIVLQTGGVLVLQALTGTYPLEVTLSFYFKTRGL